MTPWVQTAVKWLSFFRTSFRQSKKWIKFSVALEFQGHISISPRAADKQNMPLIFPLWRQRPGLFMLFQNLLILENEKIIFKLAEQPEPLQLQIFYT